MNRHSVNWTGVIPAVTTPFGEDGAIDFDGFAANIRRLMGAGSTGVVSVGCTGEFWSLSMKEREALYKATAAAVGPDGAKIVGAASIIAPEVIEQAHAAKEAGCDAALVLPPFFVHLTEAEIIAHFEAVDRDCPLPIVLYNIPGNAGNALTPSIVSRLADLDNVVAIKESSGDWLNFHETLGRVKDRIRVFCGPSSTLGVNSILAGADGLIDCFPNVWGGAIDMWDLTHQGHLEEAWRLQRQGIALTELFSSNGYTLYPATKAAMDHLGVPGGGVPRPPLRPITGRSLAAFCDALDELLEPRDTAA